MHILLTVLNPFDRNGSATDSYMLWPLMRTLERLLSVLKPDRRLCILLEETIAEDVSGAFDVSRLGGLEGSARRVFAYFWRKYKFSDGISYSVKELILTISRYIEQVGTSVHPPPHSCVPN
jgi:hypothetical protein